ncbi:Copper-exporting P-type ATPase A [Diplonema papillatum]|nr:Copper-exporting P-type ATPase A [Diplonema papillatum]
MASEGAMEDAVEIDLGRLSVERMKRSMVNSIWPRCRCVPGKCECAHCDAFVCVRSCGDEPSTLDVSYSAKTRTVKVLLFVVADDCKDSITPYEEALAPWVAVCVKPGLLGVDAKHATVPSVLSKLAAAVPKSKAVWLPPKHRIVTLFPGDGCPVAGLSRIDTPSHARVLLPDEALVEKPAQTSPPAAHAVAQAAQLPLPLAKLRLLERPAASCGSRPGSTRHVCLLLHVPTMKCGSCVFKVHKQLSALGLERDEDCYASSERREVGIIVPTDVLLEKQAESASPMSSTYSSMPAPDPQCAADFLALIKAKLAGIQHPVEPRRQVVRKATLSIAGMTCKSCVAAVSKRASPYRIEVNLAENTGTVDAEVADAVTALINTPDPKTGKVKFTAARLGEAREIPGGERAEIFEVEVSSFDYRVEAVMACGDEQKSLGCLKTGVRQPGGMGGDSPSFASASMEEVSSKKSVGSLAATTVKETVESTFIVKGMTCSSCVGRIESHLLDQPGVTAASVALATETAKVHHYSSVPAQRLAEEVTRLGYPSTVLQPDEDFSDGMRENMNKQHERVLLKHSAQWSLGIAGVLMLPMLLGVYSPSVSAVLHRTFWGSPHVTFEVLFQLCLSTPIVFIFGRVFFENAFAALRHGSATMDVLVALGVGTAYLTGWVYLFFGVGSPSADTAAVLVAFMLVGRYFECLAKGRTSEALRSLLELRPAEALLVGDDGREISVPAATVVTGDVVKVVAGAKVPVDGEVIRGKMEVDQGMITGESIPVTKEVSDPVTGGTVCVDGMAFVRATHVGAQSTLSQIIRLIADAQAQKAPVQALADQIAARFVPCVVLLAFLSFAFWLVLGYADLYPSAWREGQSVLAFSLNFLLATLVVACPCAMGLATPTAVMVGTGVGAGLGIFIKGGGSLQLASEVNAVLFDKTGTLTSGEVTVQKFEYFGDAADKKEVLRCVEAAEGGSQHPIATAVGRWCNVAAGDRAVSSAHYSSPGRGVRCEVQGKTVMVGNARWVFAHFQTPAAEKIAKSWSEDGLTVVVAAVDRKVCGVFGLRDTVKDEAKGTVHHLQEQGYRVCIVTGDNKSAAASVARQVGVPVADVFSEVLPSEKAEKVRDLQMKGYKVAFVGDGTNDGPALAAADLGVALGSGTSVAVESAGVVLTQADLTHVCILFHLAKVVMSRIKLNFVWAFGYNILALPVAAGVTFPITGQLPPMLGGIAMVSSSLLVVSSSLLLKRFKPPAILRSVLVGPPAPATDTDRLVPAGGKSYSTF